MTISILHAFASAKGDGADATQVQPSNWNAEHVIELATGKLMGRLTAGTGAVEEITCTAAGRALLDDADAAAQRTTLSVNSTAESAVITDALDTAKMAKSANLSDVASIPTARVNLGLDIEFRRGLGISNNATDADFDIDITAGLCSSADFTTALRLAAFTKRIDASWSSGTGNGGFPSGLTKTINTWYHVFVVDKTDGSIDAGFDSSITATNLLSDTGGSKYRRIGSVLLDSGGLIRPFMRHNNMFYWKAPPEDIGTNSSGSTAATLTLRVPPDIRTMALLNVVTRDDIYIYPTDIGDLSPTPSSAPLFSAFDGSNTNGGQVQVLTDTSRQIRYKSTNNSELRISVVAWSEFSE